MSRSLFAGLIHTLLRRTCPMTYFQGRCWTVNKHAYNSSKVINKTAYLINKRETLRWLKHRLHRCTSLSRPLSNALLRNNLSFNIRNCSITDLICTEAKKGVFATSYVLFVHNFGVFNIYPIFSFATALHNVLKLSK